jgi:hypothetical protein
MHALWNLAALASLRIRLQFWKPEAEKSYPVEDAMLSHCANPQCAKPFLRLRQGKLFLVETEYVAPLGDLPVSSSSPTRLLSRRVDRYWLCDQCANVWTLVHDLNQGIVLMPLPRPMASVGVAMGQLCRESA